MNPIARHAEAVLHAAPHPALRLTELLHLVTERSGRPLTPASLRVVLEERPDRFRILEAWSGRWRAREGPPTEPDHGGADAWVVAVVTPDTPPDAPQPALRLRESVRWVALGLDGRSRLDTSRWYAIALSERAARAAVARRAGTSRRAA